jgi:DNA-binding response OmpR family regulator
MKRIVLVDDDEIVADLSREVLEEAGYTVVVVRHGDVAVDAVKANLPDLVVLDIMLPGKEGLSVLKALREEESLKGLKVLVVTGKAFAEERARAQRLGADAFLKKPFEADALLAEVRGLLA